MKTHISYSEITDWRTCKLKHRLGWRDQWRKEEVSKPLRLGSAWHKLMEIHHRPGATEEDIMNAIEAMAPKAEKLGKTGLLAEVGTEEDLRPILTWMYNGYVTVYGPAGSEPAMSLEETWLVELPNPRTHVTHVKLILDWFGELDGKLTVMDHKSGQRRLDIRDLEVNPQFAFYTWGARQQGHDVRRAVRSWAKTNRPKTEPPLSSRFERHTIRFTPKMLDTAIEELQSDLELMALEHDSRNPGQHCSWRCSFRETCLATYRDPDTEHDMLMATGHVQQGATS